MTGSFDGLNTAAWRVALAAAAALAAACLAALPADAFQSPSPREFGMGGAFTAVPRDVDAIWGNPANLALPDHQGFSLSLLSLNTGVSNNSFSLGQYNTWFDGRHLTQDEENTILGSVPDDGFKVRADMGLNALGFSMGRTAVAVTPRVSAAAGIPRDYFDLILNGNEVGRTYSVANAFGEGFAVVEAGGAYAQPVSVGWADDFSVGVGVKMLVGLGYGEITESSSELRTDVDGVHTDGRMVFRYAGRTTTRPDGSEDFQMVTGHGVALDVGVAGRVGGWMMSAVLRDLSPGISWGAGTERVFRFHADTLTVQNGGKDVLTSSDSVRTVNGFTSPYPPSLHFGAMRAYGNTLVAGDWEQGFRNFAGQSTTPRISTGAEYRLLGFMPLRAGLSMGGGADKSLSGGFGLRFGPWATDFAVRNRGLTPGGSKGIAFAAGTSLHF